MMPWLAAKGPRARPRRVTRASKPFPAPVNVSLKWVRDVAPCDTQSPRSCASSRKSCPWPAAGALLPPAAPRKVQWQSPAWCCARRVCPGAPCRFPPAQIHPPVCSPICLRAHPDARVQWFFCPAWDYFLAAAADFARPFPEERPFVAVAGCVARMGALVALEVAVTGAFLLCPAARNCLSASSQCSRSRPSGCPRSMKIS